MTVDKAAVAETRDQLEQAWPAIYEICARVPEPHQLSWRHELRDMQNRINQLSFAAGGELDTTHPDYTNLTPRSTPADKLDTKAKMPDQRLRLAYRHLSRNRKKALALAKAALGE